MPDDGVRRLLDDPVFEIIPMGKAREHAQALPPGARVSVTASPAKGMDATVDLALELVADGFRVVPHLSARLTRDRAELESIVERLRAGGIGQAFVIGGDATDPGEFHDALDLLTALEVMGRPFERIGIAGYPEGHPHIDDRRLASALADKQPHAHHVATQLCFDGARIVSWVRSIRAQGITLPVLVGVTGSVDTVKLLAVAARIGVGQSLRYLRKNRRSAARLLTGRTTPDDVIAAVAPAAAELDITGLHIFTFNQITATAEWYAEAFHDTEQSG